MRTKFTKKQQAAVIYFSEHSRIIKALTHNADLKAADGICCKILTILLSDGQ